jgi:hypothetical protein
MPKQKSYLILYAPKLHIKIIWFKFINPFIISEKMEKNNKNNYFSNK